MLNCGQNKVNPTAGGSPRYDSIMNNPQQLGWHQSIGDPLTMPPIKSYPHTTKVWSNCCEVLRLTWWIQTCDPRSTKANTYIAGNVGVAAAASQPAPAHHHPTPQMMSLLQKWGSAIPQPNIIYNFLLCVKGFFFECVNFEYNNWFCNLIHWWLECRWNWVFLTNDVWRSSWSQ